MRPSSIDGRLPELFAGLEREDLPKPVPYPNACSPQAWAAATPLLLLRSLLRFDPSLPDGQLYLDPALPASITKLQISNAPLAGARLTLAADHDAASVEGLPEGVAVVRGTRSPS